MNLTFVISLFILLPALLFSAGWAADSQQSSEADYQKRTLYLPYSQVTVPIPIGNGLPKLGSSCKGTMTPGTIFYDAIKDQFMYCNSKEWRVWPPASPK